MIKFDVLFTTLAAEEFDFWKCTDPKVYHKIIKMLNYASTTYPPKMFHPKGLVGEFKSCIRLKITAEHRLVYRINNHCVEVLKCKGHYTDH